MTSSRIETARPPSVNTLTKPTRGLNPAKLRLAAELLAFRAGSRVEGRCCVLWRFRLPPNADISNYIKVIEDAGQGVLYGNDREEVGMSAWRAFDDGPPVDVRVFAWPAEVMKFVDAVRSCAVEGLRHEVQ